MPEPVSTAASTLAGAAAAVPALAIAGVPLGLRPELLFAGFTGALAAMVLLNTVPSAGDTWRLLLRTTARRIGVAVASSFLAAYCTGAAEAGVAMAAPVSAWLAFVCGAGAQHVLKRAVSRAAGPKVGEGA